MQNIIVNMCEKFHNDRLRNDRALGNGKPDNNKNNNNKKNVCSAWKPVSGSEKKNKEKKENFLIILQIILFEILSKRAGPDLVSRGHSNITKGKISGIAINFHTVAYMLPYFTQGCAPSARTTDQSWGLSTDMDYVDFSTIRVAFSTCLAAAAAAVYRHPSCRRV